MATDPYSQLGVARGATAKDIKSAYRKLAKELHPDKNKNNPKATDRFSEVTRAYDLLSDEDKRARFDRGEIDIDGNPVGFAGASGFSGGSGGRSQRRPGESAQGFGGFGGGAEGIDLGDLFGGIFGGGRPGGMGAGGMGGAGMGGGGADALGGQRRGPPRGEATQYRLTVTLPDAATGASQRITLSDGKTIDLKLPAGVEDGTQMRLAGKGAAGPGGAGDAIVTISIAPHPHFRKDGDTIRLDLPITLEEAVNGARVRVPTVEGAVMLTVAPGSSSGKTLRLKERGFIRKDGTRGDQLITLEIMLPESDADLAHRLEGWHDPRDLRAKFGI